MKVMWWRHDIETPRITGSLWKADSPHQWPGMRNWNIFFVVSLNHSRCQWFYKSWHSDDVTPIIKQFSPASSILRDTIRVCRLSIRMTTHTLLVAIMEITPFFPVKTGNWYSLFPAADTCAINPGPSTSVQFARKPALKMPQFRLIP